MLGALSSAMYDSVSADQAYMAWMQDFASQGLACGSDPTVDPNFDTATTDSKRATTDKNSFLAVSNPLASRYGQATYHQGDF
jgi:hypothetical protein